MSSKFNHLPAEVAEVLRAFSRRRGLCFALKLVAISVAAYLALLLVGSHVDRLMFLDPQARWWISGVGHAVPGLILLGGVAWSWWRRPSAREVAYRLEAAMRLSVGERFVSLEAIERQATQDETRDPAREVLRDQLRREAISLAEPLRGAKLVRDPWVGRWWGLAAVLLLVCVGLGWVPGYQFPLMALRHTQPWADHAKPSFVRVEAQPGALVVGQGGEAVIQAEVAGEPPAPIAWLLRQMGFSRNRAILAIEPGEVGDATAFDFQTAQRLDMSRINRELFLFSKGELTEGFRYRIRCGDGQTAVHTARVVQQPRIAGIRVDITPPAYSGLPEQSRENPEEPLALLPETKLRVHFATDQPTPEQALVSDGEPPRLSWDPETHTGQFSFIHDTARQIEIVVRNADGFRNVESAELAFAVREDQAPVVRLQTPGEPLELVAGEMLTLRGEASDDLGLSALVLQHVLNPDQNRDQVPNETPLAEIASPADEIEDENPPPPPDSSPGDDDAPAAKPTTDYAIVASFDLAEAGAAPGDSVHLRVRARDTAGQDGRSGELVIKVVPFTRGVAERRRLAALEGLTALLPALAESSPETPPTADELDPAAWDRLVQRAAAAGLSVDAEANLANLSGFLQREHHFSVGLIDQQTLRRLHAVTLGLARKPKLSPADRRDLSELAESVLPAIVQDRRARNVARRLFGMRSELLRIRDGLAELAAAENPETARSTALGRRAKLYLDTLETVGADLLELARVLPELDAEALAEAIGQMNTDAFFLRRGSPNRRARAAGRLSESIAELIAALRPAFRPLHAKAHAARRALGDAYDRMMLQADAETRRDDALLLERSVFVGGWPKLKNRLIAAGVVQPKGLSTLVRELNEAIDREQRVIRQTAQAWQAQRIDGLTRVGPVERVYERLWLVAEFTDPEAVGNVFDQLESLDPAADDAEARQALVALPQIPTPDAAALHEAHQTLQVVANRRLPGPTQWLSAVQEQVAANEALLGSFVEQVEGGSVDSATATLSELLTGLEAEGAAVAEALRGLHVHLAVGLSPGQADVASERLMIRLGEAYQRYEARAQRWLGQVRGQASALARSEGQTELAALSESIRPLQAAHGGLSRQIAKLAEQYVTGETDADRVYPILATFERVRQRLAAADAPTEAAALKLLQADPSVGVTWVAAQQPRLKYAEAAMATARETLAQPPSEAPDPAAAEQFATQSRSVQRVLERFVTVLDRFPEPAEVQPLRREAAALAATVEKLHDTPLTEWDPENRSRRQFELARAQQRLQRLTEQVAQAGDAAELGPDNRLRGGPPGLGSDEHRQAAEQARQRLLRTEAVADRRAVAGALAALEPPANTESNTDTSTDTMAAEPPVTPQPVAAYAWAHLRRQLVYSDLYGSRGARLKRSGQDQFADPHQRWLQRQIDQALEVGDLPRYNAATREYLAAVRDFLRY